MTESLQRCPLNAALLLGQLYSATCCFTGVIILCVACACGGGTASGRSPSPLENVDARTLYQRGLASARAGDAVRSEQYLSAALRAGHPAEEVIPALIGVCLRGGRIRAAAAVAEDGLRYEPDNWALRHLAASLRLAVGDRELAEQQLERLIERHSRVPQPYLSLIRLKLSKQPRETEQAAELLERLAALETDAEMQSEAQQLSRQLDKARKQSASAQKPGRVIEIARDAAPTATPPKESESDGDSPGSL